MPDWDSFLNPKLIYLILGVVFLSWALISFCIGKVFSGYGGWAYRAKQPADFWGGIAVLCVSALVCIGIYLHSVFPAWVH